MDKSIAIWKKLNSMYKIRNLIIHNDGQLIDFDGKPRNVELDIVKQNEYLSGDIEIMISEGY